MREKIPHRRAVTPVGVDFIAQLRARSREEQGGQDPEGHGGQQRHPDADSADTKKERIQTVYEMFPKMKERATQLAGTLSGGEQQMLAIGRGLMAGPTLLMLDEPSLGLAPLLVQQVFDLAQQINKELGVTVLLVEQNVRKSCEISDRAFVLENGKVVMSGSGKEMLESDHVREAYLGL